MHAVVIEASAYLEQLEEGLAAKVCLHVENLAEEWVALELIAIPLEQHVECVQDRIQQRQILDVQHRDEFLSGSKGGRKE